MKLNILILYEQTTYLFNVSKMLKTIFKTWYPPLVFTKAYKTYKT